ncbi:ATP-dependent DNA helicase RecG [Corynebacterium epidermidicanis]|uniref:ATP-dependent DNA helicase RecG n=1 Tax=Corynebacterium epidermidicanis TaxID=1050174 RepID=A0A0G3GPA2_9CORY|nr:ATP-dependent DNA helicase RecG [Corynebacterium epidermidicanis]AKK02984.1 ATP-dependent DNA helicase RecG [Corynebacterium epidermidicanis]
MLGWTDQRPLATLLPEAEAKKITSAFGYRTAGELLLHFPRTWSHHGSGVSLDGATEGEQVTIVGIVTYANTTFTRSGKKLTKIVVEFGASHAGATFFNSVVAQRQLTVGKAVMLSGKVKYFQGRAEISHPAFIVLPEAGEKPKKAVGTLRELSAYGSASQLEELLSSLEYIPIYPAKKGVTAWSLLGAMSHVLDQTPPIPEPLDQVPSGLVSFDEALRLIHHPDSRGQQPAIDRIKYNEALSLALVMALRRADAQSYRAPVLPASEEGVRAEFLRNLPFELTAGQRKVIADIAQDLAQPHPMQRLLQGEVGSGKTVVALIAMLQAIDAGCQCALLAPTEVLAVQHARDLTQLLIDAGLPTNVVALTGSMSTATRKKALLDIMSGQADIVVGTHALIQESVEFFDLGLVVVDEQHRFGVEQRDMLRGKGSHDRTPHQLVMTATPIPRTVAMTSFADLAVSALHELPAGRQEIQTSVVPEFKPEWVARAWERIREEVAAGRQAFVVCPRIEGEGGVEETFDYLRTQIFPELNVAMLHGRMPAEEKDAIMADFAAGGIDILVATTVIEVGINVPNASVMYIREAHSFGVSQLHQLRGRVGRGEYKSLCLLHTTMEPGTPSVQRLFDVAATSDGFGLAELDLRTRQEGDVLGTAQSGTKRRVRLLSLLSDRALIERANADATALVARNRSLAEHLVSDIEGQDYLEKS